MKKLLILTTIFIVGCAPSSTPTTNLPSTSEPTTVVTPTVEEKLFISEVYASYSHTFGKAIELGYYQTLIEANVASSTPTCGPCLGGHCGILADNEVCVSTTNRNFVGRMGHIESEIYLASPAIAAASAVAGKIVSPDEL